jgi:hypothetical protein
LKFFETFVSSSTKIRPKPHLLTQNF